MDLLTYGRKSEVNDSVDMDRYKSEGHRKTTKKSRLSRPCLRIMNMSYILLNEVLSIHSSC